MMGTPNFKNPIFFQKTSQSERELSSSDFSVDRGSKGQGEEKETASSQAKMKVMESLTKGVPSKKLLASTTQASKRMMRVGQLSWDKRRKEKRSLQC